jgi:hypothetical protein
MPLSQYKKSLYRHVETFELANSKLFADASVTNGLLIAKLHKDEPLSYKTFEDMLINAVDIKYRSFVEYNRLHNIGLRMGREDGKSPEMFDIDKDFIDTSLCLAYYKGAGYHSKENFGYKWNILKSGYETGWGYHLGVIHFSSKLAKDNYCKYAYNYTTDKYNCLHSKILCAINGSEIGNPYYFAIPQLDWSTIHINQKELWNKGLYDEAVLAEMGLKYDSSNNAIVKL